MILSILELVSSLAKIGVNVTSNQKKLLDWRFSEEGKQYYSLEDTNNLYKAIESGNTKLIDVIRKEKQKVINGLLGKISIIAFCFLLTGCSMLSNFKPQVQHLDSASLLSTEKTYQLKEQTINTHDGKIIFDDDWYAVHKDVIKDMNDNQDNLIQQLTKNKSLNDRYNILLGTSITLLVLFLAFIIFGRKRK